MAEVADFGYWRDRKAVTEAWRQHGNDIVRLAKAVAEVGCSPEWARSQPHDRGLWLAVAEVMEANSDRI